MILVVSDATPIHYLVLTGSVDLLRRLFDRVVIPLEVLSELSAEETPPMVSAWAGNVPHWIEIRACRSTPGSTLGAGEEAAIMLAEEMAADLLLVDDMRARKKAAARGLRITGTLGVFVMAAKRGLIDLDDAIIRLANTNAYIDPRLLEEVRTTASNLERPPPDQK